jgi:hypothetical protein
MAQGEQYWKRAALEGLSEGCKKQIIQACRTKKLQSLDGWDTVGQ